LPVEIGGVKYGFGDVVALDVETAVEFGFALIAAEEEEK
jgi:hypothetical protein